MRKPLFSALFLLCWGSLSYGQTNLLVSSPTEIKMNGMQNYFFVSHRSYLLYNANSSTLTLVIDMQKLEPQNGNQVPGQDVTYNTNILDSNSLVFEASVSEDKIRPKHDVKDTYTFSITGTLKYKQLTYTTMVVCSYGARMMRNAEQTAINLNLELNKMDEPMYIPLIREMIDNLKIEIIDGTVNMVQN